MPDRRGSIAVYRSGMVNTMRTTVDTADPLLVDAKELATRNGTTLRAIVEQGLRQVLAAQAEDPRPFRLRHHCFRGNGLQPGLAEGDWGEVRRRVYEGLGG